MFSSRVHPAIVIITRNYACLLYASVLVWLLFSCSAIVITNRLTLRVGCRCHLGAHATWLIKRNPRRKLEFICRCDLVGVLIVLLCFLSVDRPRENGCLFHPLLC